MARPSAQTAQKRERERARREKRERKRETKALAAAARGAEPQPLTCERPSEPAGSDPGSAGTAEQASGR